MFVDPSVRAIRDNHDRHTVFHGVNVVYKVKPYIPDLNNFDSQDSLSQRDIDDLKRWGFNLVRLGVMWEAVETAPGKYDDAYLQKIDALITKLGENGIYTLVDAHQDVLARSVCGEGIPDFYAQKILASVESVCVDKVTDLLLAPILNMAGLCKSMKDYHYKKDGNNDPLISEC
jgi:endoglycosylceramidase